MYDVRRTMYDCDYSALCAGRRSRGERALMELCAGRWRLSLLPLSLDCVKLPMPVLQKPAKNDMLKEMVHKLATSPLLVEWGIEALFLICQLLL